MSMGAGAAKGRPELWFEAWDDVRGRARASTASQTPKAAPSSGDERWPPQGAMGVSLVVRESAESAEMAEIVADRSAPCGRSCFPGSGVLSSAARAQTRSSSGEHDSGRSLDSMAFATSQSAASSGDDVDRSSTLDELPDAESAPSESRPWRRGSSEDASSLSSASVSSYAASDEEDPARPKPARSKRVGVGDWYLACEDADDAAPWYAGGFGGDARCMRPATMCSNCDGDSSLLEDDADDDRDDALDCTETTGACSLVAVVELELQRRFRAGWTPSSGVGEYSRARSGASSSSAMASSSSSSSSYGCVRDFAAPWPQRRAAAEHLRLVNVW
mmetsp:Transcript_28433/g.100765  ORF Transcript_28433/g.100765 Transcript_28433/m.100765 type:complete len:332 (+) Transcript_28433:197-1192(+)